MSWRVWRPNRKQTRWILLSLVGFVAGFTYVGRPATGEMDFLRQFPHTVQAQRLPGEHTDTFTYHIAGDPATIRDSIPGVDAAKGETSDGTTLFDFSLPSGKRATLVIPGTEKRVILVIEGEPKGVWYRASRRLGL